MIDFDKVTEEVTALLKPLDIIVHTRKMHEKFVALESIFSRELMQHGIRIESRYPAEMGLLPSGKLTLVESKRFQVFAQKIYQDTYNIVEKT